MKKNTASQLSTHVGNITLSTTAVTATKLKAARKPLLNNALHTGTTSGLPCNWRHYYCYTNTVLSIWVQPVVIGSSWNNTNHATARFIYTTGATSELGVATSISGKAGSFSQTTTTKVTSGLTLSFPPTKTNYRREYLTNYEFAKSVNTVYSSFGAITTHTMGPTGKHAGGADTVDYPKERMKSTNPGVLCQKSTVGVEYKLTRSKASTYSGGVTIKLSDVGSVGLTAQSGYDKQTTLVYQMGANSWAYICGVYDYPSNTGTPGLVYVSPIKA